MPKKIAELTNDELKKGLTIEQREYIAKDTIKANKEDIESLFKNPDTTKIVKKEFIEQIEQDNDNLKKDLEDAKKKLIEIDKKSSKVKLPGDHPPDKMSFGEYASTLALIELHDKERLPVKLTTERVNKFKEISQKTAGAGMEAEDWSEGGALISPEYSNQLIQQGYESAGLINMCQNIPTSGNTYIYKYIKDADESGGYVDGGVMVYWVDKETAPTATKPVTDQMKFELKKLAGMAYADQEILEDSPISIETLLQGSFGRAFAMAMDDGVINGTGAGDLLGVLNAPCLITVAIEGGQTLASDPIMFQNIVKMWAHLPASSRRKAVWSMNSDMDPWLPQMNMVVGSGGIPVFLPLGGLNEMPFASLYGRPIIGNDCQQALGTVGDIVLGDWSQYAVLRKSQGVRYETSIHFKFDTDEMAFKWIWRMDGKAVPYTYKTPRRGSQTKSPFITLAARS